MSGKYVGSAMLDFGSRSRVEFSRVRRSRWVDASKRGEVSADVSDRARGGGVPLVQPMMTALPFMHAPAEPEVF
jgi:hypothetical protein